MLIEGVPRKVLGFFEGAVRTPICVKQLEKLAYNDARPAGDVGQLSTKRK
jgi:hypothetical protein